MTENLVFKSNLPSPIVLKINHYDLEANLETIKQKKKASPMMFAALQVILDLQDCDNIEAVEMVPLREMLVNESILPIALMTDDKALQEKAHQAALGYLFPILHADTVVRRQAKKPTPPPAPEKPAAPQVEAVSTETVVVNHLVRSGQQVISRGDLVILGSVSAGAELIAYGNIHVYGALNGRASAGANGNKDANIFCQRLNAEIIAVADEYLSYEDIDAEFIGQPIRVGLDNEGIFFQSL